VKRGPPETTPRGIRVTIGAVFAAGPSVGRIRIKYCGLTNPADVDAAVQVGVDALGFVFVPESPRHVTPAAARALIARVPAFVSSVGLFVDASYDAIMRARDVAGFDTVQLHGTESPELCERLEMPVVKVVRVGAGTDPAAEASRYARARALLFDTLDPAFAGGTGRVFDWSLIAAVPDLTTRGILAGGLTAGNVREALTRLRPYGVDVSGGIERDKGLKDHAAMTQFAEVVNDVSNREG